MTICCALSYVSVCMCLVSAKICLCWCVFNAYRDMFAHYTIHLAVRDVRDVGKSHEVHLKLRCRNYTNSFLFTFLDHDGSVSCSFFLWNCSPKSFVSFSVWPLFLLVYDCFVFLSVWLFCFFECMTVLFLWVYDYFVSFSVLFLLVYDCFVSFSVWLFCIF